MSVYTSKADILRLLSDIEIRISAAEKRLPKQSDPVRRKLKKSDRRNFPALRKRRGSFMFVLMTCFWLTGVKRICREPAGSADFMRKLWYHMY